MGEIDAEGDSGSLAFGSPEQGVGWFDRTVHMMSALVLLATLLVFYFLLIPGMRRQDRRFKSGRRPMRTLKDLSRAGSVDGAASWVTTFIGLLALASILSLNGTAVASTGAAFGVFCGLLTISPGLSTFRDWILSGIGIVAAFMGLALLLEGNDCDGAFFYRATMLTVTLLAFAMGLLISLFKFSLNSKVGLEAFVVIELVTFLAAPMGVHLLGGSEWVAIAAAAAFGLLVGLSAEAVFGLIGIGLAVVTLWASTQTTNGCTTNGDISKVVGVVSGIVTFLIVSAVVRRFSL